jgi:hypothetical protein
VIRPPSFHASLPNSSTVTRALKQFRRHADSGRRYGIIQPQLREHRGLIPIQMFAGHLPVLEPNDPDQGKCSLPARSGHAGLHPIHSQCVCEAGNELFHSAILSEDL